MTVSNCCQWYKWCDNTAVQYQCHAALLTDCGAIAPGSWNASCSACMMPGLEATPGAMRAKSYLPIITHAYQACIDTRRTVQTQHQIADPDRAQSVGKERQIARDYLPSGQPEFVVCKALSFKCLKQRSATKAGNPCEVIPGVKIPGMRHTCSFSACTTARRRTRGGARRRGGCTSAPAQWYTTRPGTRTPWRTCTTGATPRTRVSRIRTVSRSSTGTEPVRRITPRLSAWRSIRPRAIPSGR